GLGRLDDESMILYGKPDGFPENGSYEPHCTPDGTIWFTSFDNRLFRFNPHGTLNNDHAVVHYGPESGISSRIGLNNLAHDKEGRLWAVLMNGDVCRFNGKSFDKFKISDEALQAPAGIFAGADGGILLSGRGGVARVE